MAWSSIMVLTALTALGDGAGAGTGAPAVQAGGLANIDSALNSTGRIALVDMSSAHGGNGAGLETAGLAAKGDRVVRPVTAGGNEAATTGTGGNSVFGDIEYHKMSQAFEHCRVEVARRRQVAPSTVAAGSVTLRWIIDGSGHVRDAEALSASDTDLEVAACAKRVTADWVFSKPAIGAVTVQRTFKLRP